MTEISKEKLRDLIIAADDEALEEGASPNQRGQLVISQIMRKLGCDESLLR